MTEKSAKTLNLGSIVKLIRPKQWTKNLLVLAGILFGNHTLDLFSLVPVFFGFVAFCAASSGVYVFNDIVDSPRDRNHPTKKTRPIASGAVVVSTAIVLGSILVLISLLISFYLGKWALSLILTYFVIQLFYNLYLKHEAVADVFTIAIGFIIRAVYGSAIVHVAVSSWLIYCTGALALTLGFGKRRAELINADGEPSKTRRSLEKYSKSSLDALFLMFATGSGISYGIYSVESQTAIKHPALLLTAPFVFYGIARYVLVAFNHEGGEEPADVLLKDRHVLFAVVGFIAASILSMKMTNLPHVLR